MKRLAALLAIVVVAAPVAGCAGGGVNVATAQVTRGDIQVTVSVSGNIDAPDDRLLSFAMPGKVAEVDVEKGDTVKKGDVLGRLDTEDIDRGISQARDGLDLAQTQYQIADEQLRNTIYPHYYGSYVIDVPGVWMALDKAEKSINEAQDSVAAGDASEAERLLNAVLEDLSNAKERSEAREWDFPIAVKIMELQRDAAGTQVDIARLNLQSAESTLDDAVVTAPFAGVITMVNVKVADNLTQVNLAQPAFHLIDPTNLEMTGMIDEIDIAGITLGQKAVITLDALPGMEVDGKVTYISQAATIQAGVVLYETTITLQNPPAEVKDGMSATADLTVEERNNVLTVPAQAVMRGDSGQDIVYVVEGGKLVSQDVQIGFSSGKTVEITSGLTEGETVSLEPPQ